MPSFKDITGWGMSLAEKRNSAFYGGLSAGAKFGIVGAALIGFQVAKAERGSFIPAIVGQAAAIGTGIPIAGFAAAGLSLIPGIGPFTAIVIGSLLSDYAEARFGSQLIKKIRMFTQIHKNIRHLEMGGKYQDTLIAQRQRLLAIQDMSSTMIPARRFLGQEALFMHR